MVFQKTYQVEKNFYNMFSFLSSQHQLFLVTLHYLLCIFYEDLTFIQNDFVWDFFQKVLLNELVIYHQMNHDSNEVILIHCVYYYISLFYMDIFYHNTKFKNVFKQVLAVLVFLIQDNVN